MLVQQHLQILGKRIRDRVTGIEGVASSVSFDLYGCIQVVLNPGLDKDGKPRDLMWFDISRLVPLSEDRVMQPPNFEFGAVAQGYHGAAEKPPMNKA